jgi:hypothetical protein
MDKYEKQELKDLLKWSPLIILSLPFQLAMVIVYLIVYGIPLLFVWSYKRIRWLRDDLSWYKSEERPLSFTQTNVLK